MQWSCQTVVTTKVGSVLHHLSGILKFLLPTLSCLPPTTELVARSCDCLAAGWEA